MEDTALHDLAERVRALIRRILAGEVLSESGELPVPWPPMEDWEIVPTWYAEEDGDWEDPGQYALDPGPMERELRRLVPPDRQTDPDWAPDADPPAASEFVHRLKTFDTTRTFEPEPILMSKVRLEFLLRRGPERAFLALNRYLGVDDLHRLLLYHPDRLLTLLEGCLLFDDVAGDPGRLVADLFGDGVVRQLLLQETDRFAVTCIRLLRPFAEIPGLAHMAAFRGPALLEQLSRALDRELVGGGDAVEPRIRRLERVYRLFADHGPSATRLVQVLGNEFCRKHLLFSPGVETASRMLDLGSPIWEDILVEVFGVEEFRRKIAEDPVGLDREISRLYRIPDSGHLRQVLGPDLIRRVLRSGRNATLRLCGLGMMSGLRNRLPDDPATVEKAGPELGALLTAACRHPVFRDALRPISEQAPDGAVPDAATWLASADRLFALLAKLDSTSLGTDPEIILPLLSSPADGEARISHYRRVRERLADLDSVETRAVGDGSLADNPEWWMFRRALSDQGIRVGRAQFAQLMGKALEMVREGLSIPPLPGWAVSFRLEVPEIVSPRETALDEVALDDARIDLLRLAVPSRLGELWREAFEALRTAGASLDRERLGLVMEALRVGNFRVLGSVGFHCICDHLLRGPHRELEEMWFRLALGHLLLRDRPLRERLRASSSHETAEVLVEILTERLPDDAGSAAAGLTEALTAHLGVDLPGHASLKDADERVSSDATLHHLSPLRGRAYLALRRLAERELSRWRPVASGRTLDLEFTPVRGLTNLFAGLHGEDCSATTDHVPRVFQPSHAFFLIRFAGESVRRGYLLVVEAAKDEEEALWIDVLNPSNSLSVDPDALLCGVVEHLGRMAAGAGFSRVLLNHSRFGVSNRARIAEAAGRLMECAKLEFGFPLRHSDDGFQSGNRFAWVAWPRKGG